jgi:hypothetical protein
MKMADVTISNFNQAVSDIFYCAGPRKKAWVASWNGDTYGNSTCLALTVGDQTPGGAINPASCANDSLPVLCQNATTKSTTSKSCTSENLAVVLNVKGTDAHSACQSLNMTLVDVSHQNAPDVASKLASCDSCAKQTVYVASFSTRHSPKALRAVECGCLGVTVGSPGKLIAVRPMFECQCLEQRAALCTSLPAAATSPSLPAEVSSSLIAADPSAPSPAVSERRIVEQSPMAAPTAMPGVYGTTMA